VPENFRDVKKFLGGREHVPYYWSMRPFVSVARKDGNGCAVGGGTVVGPGDERRLGVTADHHVEHPSD
jgi:hypothetical protein